MSRHFGGRPGRPAYTYIGGGGGFTPAVRLIIIVCSVVYVLTFLGGATFGNALILSFGLVPSAVTGSFSIWQLVTYLFLHGGFFHILFNMFVLWMFGMELERLWGTREFLRFYFVCGIGAGITTVIASPGSAIPTIGASGAIYGLLLAYGLLFPTRIIYLYMIIPMQARYFVVLIGAIAFMASMSSPGDGVAHIAHLGGMIFGFLYLRGFGHRRRSSHRSGPTLSERYAEWRRARLRKKFEVYYNKRQAERDRDDSDRWTN